MASQPDADFTWIVPHRLAACRYPLGDDSYRSLVAEGISLMINLHPRRHEPRTLARFELEELHLPVEDFVAPSPEQLRRGVGAIAQAADLERRVVVHCAAGLGRAGTLVSCYLTTTGLSADESIAHVRSLRPGSVETQDQVEAVRSFALHQH